MGRTFEVKLAVRERVPLLLGLVGPSGSGKTYSALRLATGIQRVSGGDVFVIDTEARRALHYADKFRFQHLPFGAPFGPLDYLAAVEHCVAKGAKVIVIDSASHEHEGPGGVLEIHDKAMGGDLKKSMSAWIGAKSQRQRFINTMLQLDCNFVLCFRAKEKLRIVRGKEPEPRGWQPIAGPEYVYEMIAKFLLLPGCNGVPSFKPEYEDERAMVKIPEQFRAMLSEPRQLSEDIGATLATWAAGIPSATPAIANPDALAHSYAACSDAATFRTLDAERKRTWAEFKGTARAAIEDSREAAKRRISDATQGPPREREPGDDDGAVPT